MKNLLKCNSLIRLVVIIVVMAFMAAQVTDTYAGGWGKWKGSSGGGYFHKCEKDEGNNEKGECPTCCDAWDKKLPADDGDAEGCNSSRFECIWDGVAVLDKETCLVWEQSPGTTTRPWTVALSHCFESEVGGRGGWRLPTIEELASLKDTVNTDPALPSGHPFSNVQPWFYWSSIATNDPNVAWCVDFSGGNVSGQSKGNKRYLWCVRGGQGHFMPYH